MPLNKEYILENVSLVVVKMKNGIMKMVTHKISLFVIVLLVPHDLFSVQTQCVNFTYKISKFSYYYKKDFDPKSTSHK